MSNIEKRFNRITTKALQKVGYVKSINSQNITVLDEDASGNVLVGRVAAVPSNGGAGFAIGAEIVDSTSGKVYRNEGTASSSTFDSVGEIDSDEVAEGGIQWASVAIPGDEVKALAATQAELVAAPGADKILQFVSATLVLDYGSEVFGESGDNLAIKYTDDSGVQVSETIETTGWIDDAEDAVTNAVPKKDAIVTAAGCVNKALVLDNLGSEISGNASDDSVITVYTAYRVIAAGLA